MKSKIAEAEPSIRELGCLFMAEQEHICDLFVDAYHPQAKEEFEGSMEEGAPAVEAAWGKLGTLEREVVRLGDVASLPSPAHWSL
jgi:hypothetical protein